MYPGGGSRRVAAPLAGAGDDVVLVDTSVWIRALSGREPFRTAVDRLLADEMALAHDFVMGELLVGDTGGRSAMLSAYEHFTRAPTVTHSEAIELVRMRRLSGRGIGWVDAHLLASALVARAELYTADGPLKALAAELGIAYQER